MKLQFKISLILVIIFSVVSCSPSSSPVDTERLSFAFNAEFRAKMIPVSFKSQGDELKGYFTRGIGKGPRPTVILLHGFPGNNRDVLGLAEVIPQAGWNALVFNYRGLYASEGLCTPMNSQVDVLEAVGFLKKEETIQKFNVDHDKIYLAGYSYGGCQSVIAAAAEPSIKGVILIAGADINFLMKEAEEDTEFGKMLKEMLRQEYSNPDVRGPDFDSMVNDVIAVREKFDIVRHASYIADKNILLIGGWGDMQATLEDHIVPFYRALQKAGAKNLTPVLLDDDHGFKKERLLLHKTIASWLYGQSN